MNKLLQIRLVKVLAITIFFSFKFLELPLLRIANLQPWLGLWLHLALSQKSRSRLSSTIFRQIFQKDLNLYLKDVLRRRRTWPLIEELDYDPCSEENCIPIIHRVQGQFRSKFQKDSYFLWYNSSAQICWIHIHVSPCNLSTNLFFRFHFPTLYFNIAFPKLLFLPPSPVSAMDCEILYFLKIFSPTVSPINFNSFSAFYRQGLI